MIMEAKREGREAGRKGGEMGGREGRDRGKGYSADEVSQGLTEEVKWCIPVGDQYLKSSANRRI